MPHPNEDAAVGAGGDHLVRLVSILPPSRLRRLVAPPHAGYRFPVRGIADARPAALHVSLLAKVPDVQFAVERSAGNQRGVPRVESRRLQAVVNVYGHLRLLRVEVATSEVPRAQRPWVRAPPEADGVVPSVRDGNDVPGGVPRDRGDYELGIQIFPVASRGVERVHALRRGGSLALGVHVVEEPCVGVVLCERLLEERQCCTQHGYELRVVDSCGGRACKRRCVRLYS